MLTGVSLSPELSELAQQFLNVKSDSAELVIGLKETQFNWRPNPDSWSMAECLLHLNIAGDRYAHLLEKIIDDARSRGLTAAGPFSHGRFSRWILANTEPSAKRKTKAPRAFTPAYGQPLTAVMPTFLHLQDQLALLIEKANGLDLARIKVPAPGLPIKVNLYVTFAWLAAHERRHLWQARQVRNHPGFPAAG